jgi:hypothetical protein
MAGCQRDATSVHVAPSVGNPKTIGAQAIAKYDANGDGFLAGDELKAFPGLLWDSSKFDRDGDSRVSSKEIADRVSQWLDQGVGLVSFNCRVTVNGRPLESAVVKLEPEEFLRPNVKDAVGYTNSRGSAIVSLASDDLPEGSKQRKVVQPGLYKVRITHPEVRLPRRYNEQTELGCEVAFDLNRTELPEFKLTLP